MKEWTGGRFDPEKFDLNAVNRELRTLSWVNHSRSVIASAFQMAVSGGYEK